MNWLRGDQHYMVSACNQYTVTRDIRANGQMRYSAWRRAKPSEPGKPYNAPTCLGMQFVTSDAAKQACEDDAAVAA